MISAVEHADHRPQASTKPIQKHATRQRPGSPRVAQMAVVRLRMPPTERSMPPRMTTMVSPVAIKDQRHRRRDLDVDLVDGEECSAA